MNSILRAALGFCLTICCAVLLSGTAFAAGISLSGLTPAPGTAVAASQPSIGFSLDASSHIEIQAGAIHMTLDGADVSSAIIADGDRVTYVPGAPLARGSHSVTVIVDEPGGGHARYSWNFEVTVDPPAPQASAAPNSAGSSDAYGNSGGIGFYSASGAGYYATGSPITFVVSGPNNGYGYVAVPGLPGTYPLVPYGPGAYYVIVFIPAWYANPNPFVTCHFFGPGYASYVVPLNRRITIRRPAGPIARSLPEIRPQPAAAQLTSAKQSLPTAMQPGTVLPPKGVRVAPIQNGYRQATVPNPTSPIVIRSAAAPRVIVAPRIISASRPIAAPRRGVVITSGGSPHTVTVLPDNGIVRDTPVVQTQVIHSGQAVGNAVEVHSMPVSVSRPASGLVPAPSTVRYPLGGIVIRH